ncbi:membrane protein [Stenoxybacter acetivorans]|uniref:outer membrane lipoprotein n=1 Tax=Stenoxybacter acetivorans TaxID=422441 RepID=UPI000568ACF7|nr:membrane protein [Stenoxybacter acetivorans]
MKLKTYSITAVILSLSVLGCANTNTLSGDVYTAEQAKTVRSVAFGTIVSANPVKIQNKETGLGGLSGGAIGGIAASGIGGGRGSAIASVVGGVVGLVVGNKIEQAIDATSALELTIRRDNGEEFVVVQKYDNRFTPGARVRIVGSGNNVNVTPM